VIGTNNQTPRLIDIDVCQAKDTGGFARLYRAAAIEPVNGVAIAYEQPALLVHGQAPDAAS
jgi:hypothetical protein